MYTSLLWDTWRTYSNRRVQLFNAFYLTVCTCTYTDPTWYTTTQYVYRLYIRWLPGGIYTAFLYVCSVYVLHLQGSYVLQTLQRTRTTSQDLPDKDLRLKVCHASFDSIWSRTHAFLETWPCYPITIYCHWPCASCAQLSSPISECHSVPPSAFICTPHVAGIVYTYAWWILSDVYI